MKCETCGARFTSPRRHSLYCSPKCRQKAYRDRERAKRKAQIDFDSRPYVSSNITDAEKKWKARRGTDGAKIITPITERR